MPWFVFTDRGHTRGWQNGNTLASKTSNVGSIPTSRARDNGGRMASVGTVETSKAMPGGCHGGGGKVASGKDCHPSERT